MNGVHDMGGMHGFGRVSEEPNEPVFHADWEGRTFAMSMVMRTLGLWNIDMSRAEQEMLPAHLYLASSYYERWGRGLEQLVLKHGLASKEEMAAGHARTTGKPLGSNLKPADVTALLTRGSYERPAPARARFKPGDRVRARNINPTGHTRLPRYARGKTGTIHLDHGTYVFPDTNAHFLGEKPQHVYSVRFTAQELWGEQASARDSVYVDMWDDYLEHV